MDHIGIRVHKKKRQTWILADGAELIEQQVRTGPRRFAESLGARPRASVNEIDIRTSAERGEPPAQRG